MKSEFQFKTAVAGLLGLALIVTGLMGCGDLNDNPQEERTLDVSVSELQRQIGASGDGNANALTDQSGLSTHSTVKTLVVGAVVIRSRTSAQGPYTDETPVSDIGSLEQDLIDSASNVRMIQLPTTSDTIRITLPPPSAEKWQLMGAAFETEMTLPDQLGDEVNQDTVKYIGFHNQFLQTGTNGEVQVLGTGEEASLSLNLQRACLVTYPPNGCAQYDEDLVAVVTAAVQILSVEVDGTEITTALDGSDIPYPLIITSADDANTAKAGTLNGLVPATASKVVVYTTHCESPTSTTVADLEDECGSVETYTTTY